MFDTITTLLNRLRNQFRYTYSAVNMLTGERLEFVTMDEIVDLLPEFPGSDCPLEFDSQTELSVVAQIHLDIKRQGFSELKFTMLDADGYPRNVHLFVKPNPTYAYAV